MKSGVKMVMPFCIRLRVTGSTPTPAFAFCCVHGLHVCCGSFYLTFSRSCCAYCFTHTRATHCLLVTFTVPHSTHTWFISRCLFLYTAFSFTVTDLILPLYCVYLTFVRFSYGLSVPRTLPHLYHLPCTPRSLLSTTHMGTWVSFPHLTSFILPLPFPLIPSLPL